MNSLGCHWLYSYSYIYIFMTFFLSKSILTNFLSFVLSTNRLATHRFCFRVLSRGTRRIWNITTFVANKFQSVAKRGYAMMRYGIFSNPVFLLFIQRPNDYNVRHTNKQNNKPKRLWFKIRSNQVISSSIISTLIKSSHIESSFTITI